MALQDRELQNINSSGELLDIFLTGVAEGDELLIKSSIQALIDVHADSTDDPHDVTKSQVGLDNVDNTSDSDKPLSSDQQTYVDDKFGNYTFDADKLYNGLFQLTKRSDSTAIEWLNGVRAAAIYMRDNNLELGYLDTGTAKYQSILFTTAGILFNELTKEQIDAGGDKSVVHREWTLAKFFEQASFIKTFSGQPNEPILTGLDGKIDPTLVSITVGELQGNFTPTGGTEYPTLSGHVPNDYWVVDGVAEPAGYTFATGDLSGQTCYNGAWMQLDANLNWVLANNYEGASTTWGAILGTLSDQTDLNNALNLKADQTAVDLKADQTALDTTNSNVSQNASDITALQGRVAGDPGDSSATSIGQLVADYNTLLSNLRTAGLIA